MLPAQPNQSLIDGLSCLQAVAGAGTPVGVRELARSLGLEATRVNRLLRTLAHLGMAEQTSDRKYVAGPAIHVLAAQSLFASRLIRRALEPLAELHRHGLIVAMGVLWRDQTCYLYHADQHTPPPLALGRVGVYPASVSGIGQVMLAWQDEAHVRELYAGREERAAGSPSSAHLQVPGHRDVEALLKYLRRVRKQGYARADLGGGRSTVAVPLGEPPYAAIGLSGRIADANVAALVGELRAVAAAIVATGEAHRSLP